MKYRASDALIQFVRSKAPRYVAVPDAPDTLAGIVADHKLYGLNETAVRVWDGGSEFTIWGSAHNNYAFRAYHDSVHARCGYALDYQGEYLTALESDLDARRANLNDEDRLVLFMEVVAQLEYEKKYGCFPLYQDEFMWWVLHHGMQFTLDRFEFHIPRRQDEP